MRLTQSFTRWSAFLFLAVLVVLSGQAPAAASETTWSSVPIYGGAMKNLGAGGRGESLVVWAATESLGVFRSTDSGRTWIRTRTPSPRASVAGVDPRDGDRAFVMFLRPEAGPGTTGLYFTTDGGATWTRSMEGLPVGVYVYQVVFDPRDEDILFAGTSVGLYRSEDGGLSWSLAGTITSNVFAVTLAPDDPRLLLLSTLDRVYRSTDGGATFTQVFGSGLHSGLVFDPSDPNRVYGTFGTLYRSTDRGLTWERIGRPFGVNHYTPAVDQDGTLYTGSDVGVTRSTNGGATFTPRATYSRRFPDDAIGSVIALPNGDVLASGHRGIWRLPDGEQSWRASSHGIRALVISGVAVTGDGRVLASAPWSGVFYSDNGTGFRVSNRGLRDTFGGIFGLEEILPAPSDPKVVYGSVSGRYFRSDNGGVTWRALADANAGQLVRIVGVDPTDPDVVYAGGPEYHPRDDYYKCHALRSRDGGATWTCLQGDDIYALDAVVFDPAQTHRLYALDGNQFKISDDQGDNWRASGHGLLTDRGLNPALARDDRGRLYVASYDGRVYRSVNGGASFAPLGRIVPDAFITDLVPDPRHPDTLYAFVAQQGIFRSRDGGQRWQRLGTGLPAALFTGVAALDTERGILWAGTQGRGLYRIDVP
jgi:photosystem II stability/assembly factor-like uncharacterized protein